MRNRNRALLRWPVCVLGVVIPACMGPPFRIEPPELELDATLEPARLDTPYSATLAVTGGVPPYTFDVVGLPAGMTFDTATGTITGTPLSVSSGMTLAVTVTDSGSRPQTVTETTTLVVKAAPVAITTTELEDARVGEAYSAQLAAANGQPPYRWAVTAGVLPEGLRLDRDSGIISGSPSTAQTTEFTIEAADADDPASTDSTEFTITVTE